MRTHGVVIVGAGLAGATAAQTLRDQGFDGAITLVGDEHERPYERPPLSKGYLLGTESREKVYVHPEGWYAEHDVDLMVSTSVTGLDPASRRVALSTGGRLSYDSLLLTTGSRPRRLTVPGADLEGVHYLRQLGDSDRLKTALASADRVAVVGGGWIGLETAAAARAAGIPVTLLEADHSPLLRVLGPEVAETFAELHRQHGVDLRTRVSVAELTGRQGRVTGVRLGDGAEVPADLVVVGVGIVPDDQLARDAGLDIGNGITVDEHLRTSHADVFAAGDVASAYHPLLRRHIRVEHWANARRQGATAARTMLGQEAVYDRLPYFFSDQYDLGMEYIGYVEPGAYDEVVFRGDPAGGRFIAFWVASSRVLAGMNVNVWDVTADIEAVIRSAVPVDAERLRDVGTPLDALTAGGPAT